MHVDNQMLWNVPRALWEASPDLRSEKVSGRSHNQGLPAALWPQPSHCPLLGLSFHICTGTGFQAPKNFRTRFSVQRAGSLPPPPEETKGDS